MSRASRMSASSHCGAGRLGSGERDLGEASGSPWPSFAPPRPLPTINGAVRVARNYGLDVHGTVWLPARSAARSARSAGSRHPSPPAPRAAGQAAHAALTAASGRPGSSATRRRFPNPPSPGK
jgi:hypothetical protein